MRKTISLKLTSQEEEIIDSMRKKGISPSEIIREAFWKYISQNEAENMEKPYKEVNQVNHIHKEKQKEDDRKEYNVVNQVDQKVNHDTDLFREKVVYQPVNHASEYHETFLDQYIYQLLRQIQQLDRNLHDWETRYALDVQYWKESYQKLQAEYQNHVKDSTKRIDDKFNQIMFYFEESRKPSSNTFELPPQSDINIVKPKKRWTSQNVRM
jgi:hypothetical protein